LPLSPDELIEVILVKLHVHERLAPLPAASAALAVPVTQDIPQHVGRRIPRKPRST